MSSSDADPALVKSSSKLEVETRARGSETGAVSAGASAPAARASSLL